MKTLYLAMMVTCTLIGISSTEIASAMTANSTAVIIPPNQDTSNPVARSNFTFPALHPSLPSYAAIHVAEPPDKTLPIVITGTLYKLFPSVIILKVQNPQGSLILISQLKPSSIGGFSLSFVPMAPLWSARGNYTVTVFTGSLELGSTAFFFNGTTYRTSPVPPAHNGALPLEQLRSGIKGRDVTCNDDMQLIIKAEDGSPACVRSGTAQKLMARGWATEGHTGGVPALGFPPIGISNITASTKSIIPGVPFYVSADVTNHRNGPVTYRGICFPPLSVSFDNIKTSTDVIHCVPISRFTLEPNQTVLVKSEKMNAVYNATGQKAAFGQARFNYEMKGRQEFEFTSVEIPIRNSTINPGNDTQPASFMPCDTPYPQSDRGIPVFYMPSNSTGRICVKYSNTEMPFQAAFDILEARNYSQKAQGTTVHAMPEIVPKGNSTVTYTIDSGPRAGFFRMLISCPGMQLAIGYDNNSNFVRGDFPWLDQTFYCGIDHGFQITGTSGIGVKFIPYR